MNDTLPGIQTASHAHRGADFELELEAMHEFYLLRGVTDVVRNPSAWAFCGQKDYERGLKMNAGAVAFDAKETEQNKFSLNSVSDHQVIRLCRSATCGVTAGLMIKFKKPNRVFFIPARFLEQKFEDWQRQAGRAKPGTASISLAECELFGKEIWRNKTNSLWDWFAEIGK